MSRKSRVLSRSGLELARQRALQRQAETENLRQQQTAAGKPPLPGFAGFAGSAAGRCRLARYQAEQQKA